MSNQSDPLYAMRHSLAHIMATAIKNLWPDAKFGVGPVVDNGFYYDVDLNDVTITESDLPKIESEMAKIIAMKLPFERYELPIDEAVTWSQENHQPYKEELLNDLKRAGTTVAHELNAEELGTITDSTSRVTNVSFYKDGDFTDLCRGPHVASTDKVGAFKLLRISGAYWRGDEKKAQMQRIYGAAFSNPKDLRNYLQRIEEAKKRDHRKLGQELDLFVISDLVGPGLPLFTPRGTTMRNELIRYSEELQRSIGYEAVWAPHMSRTELYKVSGHYDKYPERFEVGSVESKDEFMLKPMNCPHVSQIFASKPRSYRDMPQRYMETTTMYRDEKSGELHGLSRVRALTQDDSHAFVRYDQIEAEMESLLTIIKKMYLTLEMSLSIELSFRNESKNYFGEKEVWDNAQAVLEKVAREQELDYTVQLGEAAFYGPKIDIYIADALGRRWQCATVQLDFVQPERFNLEYIDSSGDKQRPAMVHKAILGSIERFLAVYIEHTAGRFPVWLAPEQIRLLTVNQEDVTMAYATEVMEKARAMGLRLTIDNANESVGKKIRASELYKVPYTIVIGEKEMATHEVLPRIRKDLEVEPVTNALDVDNFLKTVSTEAHNRVNRSSL